LDPEELLFLEDEVEPDDFAVLLSEVLPSFLLDELDLAFVELDLEPVADGVVLLLPIPVFDEDDEELPDFDAEPIPLLLSDVLDEEVGVFEVLLLEDRLDDWLEFWSFSVSFIVMISLVYSL
jgi:hypothetical protein